MATATPRTGRPLSITAEQEAHLVGLIEQGQFPETACRIAGIPPRTYYDWCRDGEAPAPEKAPRQTAKAHAAAVKNWERKHHFSQACARARAASEARLVDHLNELAIEGNAAWKAMAWQLERRFRERWAESKTIAHEGTDGPPVKLGIRVASTAEGRELARKLSEGIDWTQGGEA